MSDKFPIASYDIYSPLTGKFVEKGYIYEYKHIADNKHLPNFRFTDKPCEDIYYSGAWGVRR